MDMDSDLSHSPPHRGTIRSFNGCWTCRLRRKKCDERRPVCDTCAALHITCHYDQEKPEWMDGGVRQEEMAERLKREVRETAHLRRGERAVHENRVSPPKPRDLATPNDGIESPRPQRGADCTLISKDARENIPFGRSDTVLLMFYLEHVLPFLFPFYRPSALQGGRAWVLEMMIGSPVVRQATLCQSSYFFSLAQGLSSCDAVWETVLTQTRNAFGVLRQALQVIDGSGVTEHIHGAVRIMASIMQVQRFEIAISSFNNCQAHLNAALALFKQLLDVPGVIELGESVSRFNAIIGLLGPSAWVLPSQCIQVPSAEQAAFRFSSTLLIFDDIIASTVLQEQPRLYEYHRNLLGGINGTEPPIDLEAAIGCQNWALLQISEISTLDAWKQQCKRDGSLNVMELVRRATAIKDLLEAHLTRLEAEPTVIREQNTGTLDAFMADFTQQSETLANLCPMVTRVWAHAALVYLFVVVSGWQPASADVRYHVSQIMELLTRQISPPSLLRTMVWPFCVAGCLAEPAQEVHLRGLVEALKPSSVFGTVHKALEIMENVWRKRDFGDVTSRDLATCFRSQGDLVLLV
ncbi:fungal-specific transcription factor domain-containing protein [Hypoxylon rubiginosum]|uniref:Fungal-specific transcription factor domain-containing protein n=1 Tax=Hypoxylon rubiginosum TaxID=110542 RepID=A0ACB9YGC9_9PEZI|nr:fungal-specific transcription factor domain-containing protein [Hypoxylon rubiginosum]